MKAFRPVPARTVSIDVSAASQAISLGGAGAALRIVNDGTATVWLRFGASDVVATLATGLPIRPGVTEVLSLEGMGDEPTHVAAIAAGATGKIYFTPGSGI